MRNVVALTTLLFVACASQRVAQAPVTLPEVIIVQTAGVAAAARHITGPIAVRYAIRVSNKATETITLTRIQVQSVGSGAYTLRDTAKPFAKVIAPGSHEDVELSAGAFVESSSVVGANGPVTLRLMLFFDSAKGPFHRMIVQQVNDNLTGEIP